MQAYHHIAAKTTLKETLTLLLKFNNARISKLKELTMMTVHQKKSASALIGNPVLYKNKRVC